MSEWAREERLEYRITELEAELAETREVALTLLSRVNEALSLLGDPQHPRNNNRSEFVEKLVRSLDPYRPELDDCSDDDWDRVYALDPVDRFEDAYQKIWRDKNEALQAELIRKTAAKYDEQLHDATDALFQIREILRVWSDE